MGQITVLSGPERRRRWSDEERRQILEEAFAPGACVAQVARRYDVSTALIYTWRRKFCDAVTAPAPSTLPRRMLPKRLWWVATLERRRRSSSSWRAASG